MKCRCWIMIGMIGFAVMGVLVVAYFSMDPVNDANVARVKNGMTKSEVERVFGRPADSTEKMWYQPVSELGAPNSTLITSCQTWKGSALLIVVGYDKEGVVGDVISWENDRTWTHRLRRWWRPDPPPAIYLPVGTYTGTLPD